MRIGNAAADQRELDIYGEMIDSVYLYNKHGAPIFHETWGSLRRIVDWLCENWDQPDEGIWETRGGRKDFTYSRLMSWVAIERAIRMNRARGLPGDIVRWLAERDRIYNQIMTRGWSDEREAFVQHYGSDVLDASVLLMPLVLFIAARDPRWLSTLQSVSTSWSRTRSSTGTTSRPPGRPEGRRGDVLDVLVLVRRGARPRGPPRRGAPGLREDADLCEPSRAVLRGDRPTGELLGNFPQAFTHLALISAAFNLDKALG